jgi:hypothetical protein
MVNNIWKMIVTPSNQKRKVLERKHSRRLLENVNTVNVIEYASQKVKSMILF